MPPKRRTQRESCGFVTGLLLHRAHGEPPCAVCREAHEQRITEGWGRPLADTAPVPEPLPRDAGEWEVPERDFNFPSIF